MNYTLIYILCLCQPFGHVTWNLVPSQYTCRTRRKQQVKWMTAILFTSYLYIPSSDPIRIAILVLTFKGIPLSFRWITPDTWRSWSAWRQLVGVTTSASSSPSVPWFSLLLPSWSGSLFSCLSWFIWWTTQKKVYTEISCFFDRWLQTYLDFFLVGWVLFYVRWRLFHSYGDVIVAVTKFWPILGVYALLNGYG